MFGCKESVGKEKKRKKSAWTLFFFWIFSEAEPNIQVLFFIRVIVITIAEGICMAMVAGFES